MSLEEQVARLARSVEAHEDVAVREIIRQRDKAQVDLVSMTNARDYWAGRSRENGECSERLQRRVIALRGVITRMKRVRRELNEEGK